MGTKKNVLSKPRHGTSRPLPVGHVLPQEGVGRGELARHAEVSEVGVDRGVLCDVGVEGD